MTLPAPVEAAIVAHARRASPQECCGLLLGRDQDVAGAVATRNAAADAARRYLVDPVEYFQVIRAARRDRLEVIGAYHSHPRSSAAPSPTDAAEGFSHFVFLIVGLGVEPPEVAAWTWSAGNFAPLPIVRLR